MSSKKYKLLLAVFFVFATTAFSQVKQTSTSGYDVYDSTVITKKRQPQQNEFWNNSYNFPSKPRNMWEVGVSGGAFNVTGDVTGLFPTFGFAAHVRKALGYVFSLRLQYMYGTAKGLSWVASENFQKNGAWNQYSGYDTRGGSVSTTIPGRPAEAVYYNYKNKTQDLSLQGIVTLNNIRFHKNKSAWVVYTGAGVGASAYEVKINALNANGDTYSTLFKSIYSDPLKYKNRKDIRKALKDGMDDTYETSAQTNGERRGKLGGSQTLRLSTTLLAGIQFKLSKRINLALEDRHTFIKDDLLDGQQWQEHPVGNATLTPNWDSYNYLSLGLNFNIGSKAVEPLWWLNPLDYAYGELNNPRHTKFPKPVFDDADGDGVVDQLDREPNTPAGCPVDSHGVTQDTDGDGVPDCKDKQLITPTECQPVDADGVGKCPDPECCKNIQADSAAIRAALCPTDYPSLSFKGVSSVLTNNNKAMLHNVAEKMKANPTCNITINGYPEASKASQAVCQKRADAVKKYMVEKEGISADRITTNCEVGGGDKNTVDIKSN
ncbi:MAG: OmpA family protein [Ferruginibacter sp.]